MLPNRAGHPRWLVWSTCGSVAVNYHRSDLKALDSLPTAPGHLPIIGHLHLLIGDRFGFIRSLPAYGDLVRIRIPNKHVVVACTPELTGQVLLDDRTFDKGGPLFDRLREFLGNGLASCPHQYHRRYRRLVQPAFHASRFPDYAETMTARITQTTNAWTHGQILDVHGEMQKIASGILGQAMFCNAVPPDSMDRMLEDLNVLFAARRALIPPQLLWLATQGKAAYRRAGNHLRNALELIITERRANTVDEGGLLSSLLAARIDDEDSTAGGNSSLSDREIVDQLITFFVGGIETTASVMTWAQYLLGTHPDVEKCLHNEVDAVLAGNPARYEHLPRLELTARIITETLRLYPPAWLLTRNVTKETHLGGHRLPVGTVVVFSPYVIHHRSDLYQNPESFDPDRWQPDSNDLPRYAMLPFSTGPRKCIGDRFGMTESVLTTATIATRWYLRPLKAEPVRPARGLGLAPSGFQMRATARR